jgi:hypothetical protein
VTATWRALPLTSLLWQYRTLTEPILTRVLSDSTAARGSKLRFFSWTLNFPHGQEVLARLVQKM